MFSKIQNPNTGKWVDLNGIVGKRILNNYIKQVGWLKSFPNSTISDNNIDIRTTAKNLVLNLDIKANYKNLISKFNKNFSSKFNKKTSDNTVYKYILDTFLDLVSCTPKIKSGGAYNHPDIDQCDKKCPICLELLDTPVTLGCRHIFCNRCIRSWLLITPNCPYCRANVQNDIIQHLDNNLIQEFDNTTIRGLDNPTKIVILFFVMIVFQNILQQLNILEAEDLQENEARHESLIEFISYITELLHTLIRG
tara:strand:- start:6329 stop:7081 length:753 start_codon:yes stop_codon:yes gene_type:complete